MQRSCRRMVFVSGAPGAGKTSLAIPLAAELGFALACKDKIKETLHDALGAPPPDLAGCRDSRTGATASERYDSGRARLGWTRFGSPGIFGYSGG